MINLPLHVISNQTTEILQCGDNCISNTFLPNDKISLGINFETTYTSPLKYTKPIRLRLIAKWYKNHNGTNVHYENS